MICVGQNVVYRGKVHRVQDKNNLSQLIRIGIVSQDGICWDTYWVPISDVHDIHEVDFVDGNIVCDNTK